MRPLIEIRNLRAGYGSINVLWDVDLDVPQGRVTAIIGPNGAGKTTLLRAIMGLVPVGQGSILHAGRMLNGTSTWDVVARRIVMIPEGRLVFADMTVEDNLRIGAFPRAARARWKQNLDRVYGLFPRLAERRRQSAGSLSGGEAQMLAIGRGLMEEPEVLLVDEPSLGLAPLLVDAIFETLAVLKADSLTLVLVEQNTHRAVALADHVCLLRSGAVAFTGAASEADLTRLHGLYFSQATQEGSDPSATA